MTSRYLRSPGLQDRPQQALRPSLRGEQAIIDIGTREIASYITAKSTGKDAAKSKGKDMGKGKDKSA